MLRKRKKDDALPAMRRTIVVFLHGGYWLLYLLLLLVIFAVAAAQFRKSPLDLLALFPLIVLCVAPNLVSFYSFYFLLFPRFLAGRKIFALLMLGTAICLLSAFAGLVLSLVFFGFQQPILADAGEFATLASSLFVIAAIHGGIALVIRGFVAWYDDLKLKEELARKNYETELALIKSQINPHFLFNTINNIDVLITKDAARASAYLNKLSGVLRYMVYEAKNEKIALATELEYLEKYLELQKIRTVNPDYVQFKKTGEANGFSIAPMILFPFVENAFKHTENKKNSNKIRIRVSIEKEKLVFECENSYHTNGNEKQDFGGAGNELIKKRLNLIYLEKHRLEISDDGKIYQVRLTLL